MPSLGLGKEKGRRSRFQRPSSYLAPQVGLEPTTLRLTAECSAIELLRNKRPNTVFHNHVRARSAFYSRWKFERQPLTHSQKPYRITIGCSTRQRQLNAIFNAAAPFASLFSNFCITVIKNGFRNLSKDVSAPANLRLARKLRHYLQPDFPCRKVANGTPHNSLVQP